MIFDVIMDEKLQNCQKQGCHKLAPFSGDPVTSLKKFKYTRNAQTLFYTYMLISF